MTPFNYLLANQSFSLQISSPNKKARYQFTGRSLRVTKTISQKIYSPMRAAKVYHKKTKIHEYQAAENSNFVSYYKSS
jgi:hypothetical protein